MFGIGFPELIVIMVIALVVIGPSKLPDLAKALGKGMREFRKASQEIKDSFNLDEEINDLKEDLKEGTLDSIGELDDYSAYNNEEDEDTDEKSVESDETVAEVDSEDEKSVEPDATVAEADSEDEKKEPVVNE